MSHFAETSSRSSVHSSNSKSEIVEIEEPPEHSGVLSIQKGLLKSWKPFYYIIRGQYLVEYKVGSNTEVEDSKVSYLLEGSLAELSENEKLSNCFVLLLRNGKSIMFLANSQQEVKKWVDIITQVSTYYAQKKLRSVNNSNSASSSSNRSYDTSSIRTTSSSAFQSGAESYGISNYDHTSTHRRSSILSFASNKTGTTSVGAGAGSFHDSSSSKVQPAILNYLESLPDPVVVGNIDGYIISANSRACQLFKQTKGSLDGGYLTLLMPEPYRSQHDSYLFRHEKFKEEKMLNQPREVQGVTSEGEIFNTILHLTRLPEDGFYMACFRTPNQTTDHSSIVGKSPI